MRIEVITQINETENEVHAFNVFDSSIVFVSFIKEVKPIGKRTWKRTTFWDKYQSKLQNKIDEPELTDKIKLLAKEKFMEFVKVLTWSEYKKQ